MTIKIYKCPSCGAGIHFKPELQKFKCDFCLSEYTEEEIDDIYTEKDEKEELYHDNIDSRQLSSYECNSCGAKIVTDDTTTATFCYYCHNPVIISDRLIGNFQPNKLIPFSVDKNKAKQNFLDWAQNKRFVPNDFYSNSQLEKITGIYLPYWWADCEVDIDYIGEARNIRVWRSGDREFTETKKYQIVRKGQINIENVGEVAFTKIDDTLLNGIAPYNENEIIDFSMAYLSGFFAEQYDMEKEDIIPKVEDRVGKYSKSLIDETISGFNLVNDIRNNSKVNYNKWSYTLLPTWILTYLYKGRTFVYAVNGQTGKSFGELPFNKQKAFNVAMIIFIVTFITLLIGGMLIW